jgi:hypothetical protein
MMKTKARKQIAKRSRSDAARFAEPKEFMQSMPIHLGPGHCTVNTELARQVVAV